jgi:hypothetical protein
MSYGYSTPYNTYTPIGFAQPHADPYFVSPNSPAAQLGLTPEEVREVLEDQERWMREEYQEEVGMHIPTTPTQYQQDRHNSTPLPAPTAHPELERHAYEGYRTASEPPTAAMSHDDDDDIVSDSGDVPTWYQHPTTTLDGTYPTPQPEYSGYDTTDEYDGHVVLFDGCKSDDGANMEPERDSAIEQLAHELIVSGDTDRSWAEEMEIWRWDWNHRVSIHPLIIPQHKPRRHLPPGTHPNPLCRTTNPPGPTTHLPTPGTSPPATTVSPDTPVPAPTPTPHPHKLGFRKINEVT